MAVFPQFRKLKSRLQGQKIHSLGRVFWLSHRRLLTMSSRGPSSELSCSERPLVPVRLLIGTPVELEYSPPLMTLFNLNYLHKGAIPGGSEDKVSACKAGDSGSIPGLGRSPGEGNDNPLQCPCLENPMDRGAWRATVHGSRRVGHD